MPVRHQPRRTPCTHCGDVVLVAERTPRSLFGARRDKSPTITFEHADPSPDGEVFDAVDEGCRRARVAP